MALDPTLTSTAIIDADHPAVLEFAARVTREVHGMRDQAIALYYAVRDEIRYDAYQIDLSPTGLSASEALRRGRGWCVSKAVLLAAACRALGIPARLGYADVRNHLSTARMRALMGTDVFHWHGYTSLRIGDGWVKATPAFNVELCTRFRLKPLEFDGRSDSLYHAYDEDGRQHMEYLHHRGEFNDVPLQEMRQDFARFYPQMGELTQGDFEAEVRHETSG